MPVLAQHFANEPASLFDVRLDSSLHVEYLCACGAFSICFAVILLEFSNVGSVFLYDEVGRHGVWIQMDAWLAQDRRWAVRMMGID